MLFPRLFLASLFLLVHTTLLACTCHGHSTVKKAYKAADVVVAGKVVGIDTLLIVDSNLLEDLKILGLATDSLDERFYTTAVKKK